MDRQLCRHTTDWQSCVLYTRLVGINNFKMQNEFMERFIWLASGKVWTKSFLLRGICWWFCYCLARKGWIRLLTMPWTICLLSQGVRVSDHLRLFFLLISCIFFSSGDESWFHPLFFSLLSLPLMLNVMSSYHLLIL